MPYNDLTDAMRLVLSDGAPPETPIHFPATDAVDANRGLSILDGAPCGFKASLRDENGGEVIPEAGERVGLLVARQYPAEEPFEVTGTVEDEGYLYVSFVVPAGAMSRDERATGRTYYHLRAFLETVGVPGSRVYYPALATPLVVEVIGPASNREADQAAGFAGQASAARDAAVLAKDAVQTLVSSVAGLRTPERLLLVDAAFVESTDGFTFSDVATAITAAEAIIAADGGRVLIRLYHDTDGQPLAIPTPHTADSLRAAGIDVETADGSGDGKAARFSAHLLGWWLGQHPLDESVLRETGYVVNLDQLPFPVSESGEALFPPSAHRHDWGDLDNVPPLVPFDAAYADTVPPDPAGYSAGAIIHNNEGDGALYGVVDAQSGKRALRLGEPAWADVTDKPSTFPPSAHMHWQRVFYSDFLTTNRSGKTVTTSGYESTATGATASGGTSGHLVNIGTPVQRFHARVSVGSTTSMFAGFYACSTSASQTNGARFHIIRQAGGWVFTGVQYVGGTGGSPSPLNTTLTGTPSDGSTWDIVLETDGTGTVAVTVTPLGGSPQSFTVTVPAGTVGSFGGQLNAGGGGYVLSLAGYIKTS